MSLFLAIAAEHKGRTGHSVEAGFFRQVACEVCMHLRAFEREMDQAIREEEERAIADDRAARVAEATRESLDLAKIKAGIDPSTIAGIAAANMPLGREALRASEYRRELRLRLETWIGDPEEVGDALATIQAGSVASTESYESFAERWLAAFIVGRNRANGGDL